MTRQRRDFLSKALAAAAGSALMMKAKLPLSGQNTVHPLYFDGLTYLSENKEDIKKCGLSGFIWDVSDGEEVQGKYVQQMIPSLKTMSQTAKFLRGNDQDFFWLRKGVKSKRPLNEDRWRSSSNFRVPNR